MFGGVHRRRRFNLSPRQRRAVHCRDSFIQRTALAVSSHGANSPGLWGGARRGVVRRQRSSAAAWVILDALGRRLTDVSDLRRRRLWSNGNERVGLGNTQFYSPSKAAKIKTNKTGDNSLAKHSSGDYPARENPPEGNPLWCS